MSKKEEKQKQEPQVQEEKASVPAATNTELEKQVTALKREVAGIKEALRTLFEHRDMAWEVRRAWTDVSRGWFKVKDPVEPPPASPVVEEESLIDDCRRTLRELDAVEARRESTTK